MPKYRFLVVTSAGSRVEAESEADSAEALQARLAARGCTVEKLECLDGPAELPPAVVGSASSPRPAAKPAPKPTESGGGERLPFYRRCAQAVGRRGIVLAAILLVVAAGLFVWMHYGSAVPGTSSVAMATPVKHREPQAITPDQALARHREVVVTGKAPGAPYSLHLSPGWKSTTEPDGSGTFSFQNGSVIFGIRVLGKPQGGPEPEIGQARTAFESLVYGTRPGGEDERAWLQHEQAQSPVLQTPPITRDGRQWTGFEASDSANQRVWRAQYTDGPGCGYLVYGQSPTADSEGKLHALIDTAFRDFELPPAAPELAQARRAAQISRYQEALREPKVVISQGKDPAFAVALGNGWRELPLEGEDRVFLMGNNAALSFQVQTGAALMGIEEARQWFRAGIGCKDHPEWPIVETTVTKADGKPWRDWRAETEDDGAHVHWRGQWCSDLEHSYLLTSRTWDQTPELDALAGQLLDQAFSNFSRAPLHTQEYRGGARPYVFELPGAWKALDLSANGFDKAWEGPAEMVLRVETGAGNFTPASLPGLVSAARENFAKTYRLGPPAEAGRWVRFRADIDISDRAYACFFSLTVTSDAYYMVSVVIPTANLERCESVVADIQNAIKLP